MRFSGFGIRFIYTISCIFVLFVVGPGELFGRAVSAAVIIWRCSTDWWMTTKGSKFGFLLNVPWIICCVSRALHAWHAVCKEVLIGWWHRRSADFLSVILVCRACLAFVMRCCVRLSVPFLVFLSFSWSDLVSCLAGLYHRLLLFDSALLTGGWPLRGRHD